MKQASCRKNPAAFMRRGSTQCTAPDPDANSDFENAPDEIPVLPSLAPGWNRPKQYFRSALWAVLGALAVSGLSAAERYVDATVRDVYDANGKLDTSKQEGTADKPWKTLAQAVARLEPGDVCWIRSGDYRETLQPLKSGMEGKPIVYKAVPGAVVRINGCDVLPVNQKWESADGKIYKTLMRLPLGEGAQVFERQSMLMEARWPNAGETAGSDAWLLEAPLANAPRGSDIHATQFRLPVPTYTQNLNPKGARIWVTPFPHQGWCNYTARVDAFDAVSKVLTCSLSKAIPEPWTKCKASVGDNLYYLSGLFGFLDSQKEYFYDSTSEILYLYRADGKAPAPESVEYKVRHTGIDLRGRSHIRVEGLQLFGCGLLSDEKSSQIVLDRLEARYVSHWGTAVCDTAQPAAVPPTGIQLLGKGMELRNSRIQASYGNGVDVRGLENTVINNRIIDCNYYGLYYASIAVSGARHQISYNTVLRSGRSLLGGSFQNVQITHNEMAHANMVSADGACIYLGWTDGGNSEIAYNFLHHNGGEARNGTGFYLDANSYNFLFHHNLTEGVHLGAPSSHIVVAQNTTYGRGIQRVGIGNETKYGWIGTYLFQNICVPSINDVGITSPVVQPAYEVFNHLAAVHGDPLYYQKNELSSGIHFGALQANSPALNVGKLKLEGLHEDVTDNRPDLGAFERGATPWEFGQNLAVNRVRNFSESKNPLTNRLINGGFEQELSLGWKLQGNVRPSGWYGNDPRFRTGGTLSAQTDPGASLSQTLTGLRPNARYVLSVWSRIDGTGTGQLSVSGSGIPEKVVKRTGDRSVNWFLNELEFQTPANSTTATVCLKNIGNTVIYWDHAGVHWDMSGEVQACPPEQTNDLVRNRGFEYGTHGWAGYASVIEQTQMEKKAGDASLRVTGRSQPWAGPFLGLSLVKGQRYAFSAWLKLPAGSAQQTLNLGLNIRLQKGAVRQPNIASAVIRNDGWTELRGEMVFSEVEPVKEMQLFFYSASLTDYFLDQVSVLPVVAPIDRQRPVVTWNQPASIAYGSVLGAGQCNASASIQGSWAYQPPMGTLLSAGIHTLNATFTPSDLTRYLSVTTSTTLEVTKRPLTVTAQNATRIYGAANPVFNVGYNGFIAGESQAALSGTLAFDCTALGTSAVGEYSIIPRGLTSSNYAISFRNGILTVTKAPQSLSFSLPSTRAIPDGALKLSGIASSGLPVQFSSSNPSIAIVNGDQLVPLAAGSVRITATQPGDKNYTAVSVSRDLQVQTGPKSRQTIQFDPLPTVLEGAASLTLSAQASSGLVVNFQSSNPQIATVQGNVLKVLGAGSAEITAVQPGNAVYEASSTAQTLTVIPSPERIRNGGFEAGTAPWYAFACVAALSADRHSGRNALHVTQRSIEWGSCGQQTAVQAGRDYRVQAWVKMGGVVPVQSHLLATLYLRDGGVRYEVLASGKRMPNKWEKLEEVLAIPETLPVRDLQVSVVTPGSLVSFLADDFSVYDLSLTSIPVLSNPSFESPRVSGTSVLRPSGAGWTFEGESGILAASHSGNKLGSGQAAYLCGNSALRHNLVGLGVGQSYQVVLDAILSRLPAGVRPMIEVWIGGELLGTMVPGNTADTFLTPVFQATAGTRLLELRAKNLQGPDMLILDGIEVVLVP